MSQSTLEVILISYKQAVTKLEIKLSADFFFDGTPVLIALAYTVIT